MREGWEKLKIKDICTKGSSNIAQNKIEGLSGDYAVYGASGYVQNIDFYHQDNPYIGIVKDGSGVGRVNVYPAYSSLLGTLQYILPKEGYLLQYVAYALKSKNLSSFAAGAAIPHIYFKDYGECEILVPSQETQQQIVSELDLLSHILDQKRQQLKEYDALAESIFYDMFGDESKFSKKKLVDVTSKIGSGATPKGGNQSYKEEGISLIRSLNVHNSEFKYEDLAHIDEDQASALSNVTIESNDVLFNITGASVTRCCIVPDDILPARVNQHVAILRPKVEVLNHIYLSNLLVSSHYHDKLYDLSKSNGATREAITKAQLENFLIPLPPLSLQQSFAEKIESIEHQKQLLKESIKETETLFQSRMDYWFNA